MALSGLEIYKHLPKTNCRECGFPTCLAFAMQLAAKKTSLDKCPHVTQEAKQKLESASAPPIKLVTIGSGDNKIQIGNETVMFRHEETFHHPCGIGILVEDKLSIEEFQNSLEKIKSLQFERVGQKIKVELICINHTSQNKDDFLNAIKKVLDIDLNLILMTTEADLMKEAVNLCKDKRPLLYAADKNNFKDMSDIAKQNSLPLAVKAESLDELSSLSEQISQIGVEEIILSISSNTLPEQIFNLTQIRRQALKKRFKPFGYPVITFAENKDEYIQIMKAASFILKYTGVVILNNFESWEILPLLTVRQNIYTDPQKPLQVEPKLYEIGKVNENSPVLVTTNFSLTYYTVEAEVEASKVASFILCVDAEGMSVLTGWAAEKFTPEKINKSIKNLNLESKVSHRNLIIPGYVAVMSGKLEEESGWKVMVGPREASGIPTFLRNL